MDDSKPLIKKETTPSPWPSCIFLTGRHRRLFVLMAVMLGIAFVVIVSTFYSGVTSHSSFLSFSRHHHGLTTLMPPNEVYWNSGFNEAVYRIMFDAGSTGTRIHIYKFAKSTPDVIHVDSDESEDSDTEEDVEEQQENGSIPRLLGETFHEIKPGLSFYASDPSKVSETLIPLLEKAKTVIPSSQWNSTILSLKATAGLRLLPKEVADQLLTEVEKLFQTSEFLVLPDSVSIMDGVDEGILAWVTVNYLEDKLDKTKETYGSLDLGGGSTQITFTVNSPRNISSKFLHPLKLFNKSYQLYTYSYLGFGLMSARYQMFGQNESQSVNSNILHSVCIAPRHSSTWIHAGHNYTITGDPKKRYGFNLCYSSAKNLVKKIIDKPAELKLKKFYTFSYYFDRAIDAKLVESSGGKIKVDDFRSAAVKVCNNPHKDTIFLCMDLTYISALLKDGFGFKSNAKILLAKEIKQGVVSWALGAALTLTDTVDHLI